MKLSTSGARLIEGFEGFSSRPYRDSVGVWTIGFGSTKGVGPNTPRVTRAQAEQRMMREIDASYGHAVNALRLPLNQHQFDALVSFVYNVGPGGVASSTGVGRALRRHDWHGAANALLAWDKAGGRALAGLTRRRHAERALFLKPTAQTAAHYLTTWERNTVAVLNHQRAIAKRNGGWEKIGSSHLKRAAKAKADLRGRVKQLSRLDTSQKHRRQRIQALKRVIA